MNKSALEKQQDTQFCSDTLALYIQLKFREREGEGEVEREMTIWK